MIRALAALLIFASPVAALDLTLPSAARQTVARNSKADVYAAPVGVFENGQVPQISVEGAVERGAWRIRSPGLTPLQVIRPLRAQLERAGLEIALDCAAQTCGGFDFRFATETLPGPNMHVNVRSYHFVTALRREGEVAREVVTVLASTNATSAFVQIIQAGKITQGTLKASTAQPEVPTAAPVATGDVSQVLLAQGHVVLEGLDFETGSSELGQGPFAVLRELATFLGTQPGLRIALVGHTDSVGGLNGNIALSKRRAQSVRRRLIENHDVNGSRIEAEGMGYLSPVASNLDATGREANRRVEVILLAVE